MSLILFQNESVLRLCSFFGVFFVIAIWEWISPRRNLSQKKWKRWSLNFGLVAFNTLVLRLAFVTSATGFSFWVQSKSWGFFNSVDLPFAVAIFLSVIILDLIIYGQHVMFHHVPIFWRFHSLHHSDLDYDVSTGNRFHPIEIILSMGIKIFAIILLGVPPVAVILFEVLLNGTAMFNHGNIYLAPSVDRLLRYFIVTPDMHRVHHSIYFKEANSNFGFNLPWWDHLFRTYIKSPKDGHLKMTIGIAKSDLDLLSKSKK